MKKVTATALLLTALVLPVVLFLLLRSHLYLSDRVAAGIAVAVGWALNVAWAFVAQGTMAKNDSSRSDSNTLSIAMRFGWICPIVLVLLTWLAWRLAA